MQEILRQVLTDRLVLDKMLQSNIGKAKKREHRGSLMFAPFLFLI